MAVLQRYVRLFFLRTNTCGSNVVGKQLENARFKRFLIPLRFLAKRIRSTSGKNTVQRSIEVKVTIISLDFRWVSCC